MTLTNNVAGVESQSHQSEVAVDAIRVGANVLKILTKSDENTGLNSKSDYAGFRNYKIVRRLLLRA